jgi:protein-disulfide isomerase
MENNKYLIPLAIVLAGILIAGAIYMGGRVEPRSLTGGNPTTISTDIKLPKVTAKDHIVGSADAPIVIVEYSDTECPFCKAFHQTMQDVVTEYDGKVAWVYRHFPIAQLHSKAPKEAEATECAAEQGGNTAFWNFINKVFATTNSNDSLDPTQLPIIAGQVGLDVDAFNKCLSSGKYTEMIQDSIKEAIAAGAQGTPYSVIVAASGKKDIINGAEEKSSVEARINALLK